MVEVRSTANEIQPASRALRYSLRTAFVVVTLLGVVLGMWVVRAKRQRAAVAAIHAIDGSAHYTYEHDSQGHPRQNPTPATPAWLRQALGEDFLTTLDGVYLDGPQVNDAAIESLVPKIRDVATLRWLELRGTVVTDAALSHIAELTQIKRLFIRADDEASPRVQITDAGLADLARLRELRHLCLNFCSIDGSGFSKLDTLVHLEGLDLRHTSFSDAAAPNLRNFPRLKYLNLWQTPITDASVEHIATLSSLEELFFWRNELTDAAAPGIGRLTRLRVLDLDGTQISDAGIESLRPLVNLEELRLRDTNVKDANLESFAELQVLSIGSTPASDVLLEKASLLPRLRSLDCMGAQNITDAGVQFLEHSASLEDVILPQGVSKAAVQRLQVARPKLRILQ